MRDNCGYTPLSHACVTNNTDFVNYLLANGADVSIAGHDGKAPIHVAASHGYDDIVTVLLKEASSLESTTKRGETAPPPCQLPGSS